MANPLKFYRKNTCTIILDVCDYQFHDGDTIYFTVKEQPDSDPDDSDALIKADWVYGTDVVPDEDGSLQLVLTAAETNIPFGDYFYDLKIVTAEDPSTESTLVTGDFTIMDVATLRV
jgi:hypothetical protein